MKLSWYVTSHDSSLITSHLSRRPRTGSPSGRLCKASRKTIQLQALLRCSLQSESRIPLFCCRVVFVRCYFCVRYCCVDRRILKLACSAGPSMARAAMWAWNLWLVWGPCNSCQRIPRIVQGKRPRHLCTFVSPCYRAYRR